MKQQKKCKVIKLNAFKGFKENKTNPFIKDLIDSYIADDGIDNNFLESL